MARFAFFQFKYHKRVDWEKFFASHKDKATLLGSGDSYICQVEVTEESVLLEVMAANSELVNEMEIIYRRADNAPMIPIIVQDDTEPHRGH